MEVVQRVGERSFDKETIRVRQQADGDCSQRGAAFKPNSEVLWWLPLVAQACSLLFREFSTRRRSTLLHRSE